MFSLVPGEHTCGRLGRIAPQLDRHLDRPAATDGDREVVILVVLQIEILILASRDITDR